jgi:hypothetical protein
MYTNANLTVGVSGDVPAEMLTALQSALAANIAADKVKVTPIGEVFAK